MSHAYFLQQSDADVPQNDAWLSKREVRIQNGLHFAKRRTDWRRGRWTAKYALARFSGDGFTPDMFEVLANENGAPEAFLNLTPFPMNISIAHSGDLAVCAVSSEAIMVGCDIERIEPRSATFAEDYFTELENVWLDSLEEDERASAITEIWSAKESVLKALQVGLRADTRSVEIRLAQTCEEWSGFEAHVIERAAHFTGWRRRVNGFCFTIATTPVTKKPISVLEIHS